MAEQGGAHEAPVLRTAVENLRIGLHPSSPRTFELLLQPRPKLLNDCFHTAAQVDHWLAVAGQCLRPKRQPPKVPCLRQIQTQSLGQQALMASPLGQPGSDVCLTNEGDVLAKHPLVKLLKVFSRDRRSGR